MRKNLNIYISIFIYLIGICIFLPYTSYYFNSVDYAQYYSIALKYCNGNFSEALNLYWPPLYSWLLIPFISFLENPMLASQVLNVFIGLFCVYVFFRFDFVKRNFEIITLPIFIVLPICILSFALMYSGPDLLFAALLLLLVQLLYKQMSHNQAMQTKSIVFTALLGSLLYLTKAMGFYLFVAIIVLFLILDKKQNRKNIFLLFGCFILFVGSWVLALSIKNNGFTIGLNGAYNFALISPDNFNLNNPILQHPFFANKFVPFTKQGFCAWEWPNEALTNNTNIFSFEFIKHYCTVVLNNLKSIYYIFASRNFGMIAFVVLLFVAVQKKFVIKKQHWFILMVFALPLILYSLIFVHYRYLYVVVLAALLLLVLLINYSSAIQQKWIKVICLSATYLSLLLIVKRPIKEMFYKSEKDVAASILISDVLNPINTLKSNYEADKKLYAQLKSMDKKVFDNKIFCGLKSAQTDTYNKFLEIAMLLNMKFYGEEIFGEKAEMDLKIVKPHYVVRMDGDWVIEKYE